MTKATVGALRVDLALDTAAFASGLAKAQSSLKTVGAQMQAAAQRMQSIGTMMTAAITAPLAGLGAIAVAEASEMKDAMGQVEAALASMGAVAGQSLDGLKAKADALAGASLFEDDQILRQVTANLLTFGKIAGSEFDRAQQAALDMATRLQTDLKSATILVGKSLNDPVRGMAALRKAGVQLGEDQEALVRRLAATGDTAGAQRILLAELESQFRGSAQAARDNAPPLVRMQLAFKSMAGDVGKVLLPTLEKAAKAFEGLTDRFGKLSPEMQRMVVIGGVVAAALGPVLVAIGAVTAAVGAIAGSALLPWLAGAAAAVAFASVAFQVWSKELKAIGKALVEALGPMIPPMIKAMQAALEAVRPVAEAVGKVLAWAFGPIVVTALKGLVSAVTSTFEVVGQAFRVIGALIKGDWSGAWNAAGSLIMSVLKGLWRLVEVAFPGITENIRKMVSGVTTWLTGKLFQVLQGVIAKVKAVSDAFFRLYDAVVGHSFVPDLVTETGQWFARLDKLMLQPAQRATARTAEQFEAMRDRVRAAMDNLLTDDERAMLEFRGQQRELRLGLGLPGVDQDAVQQMIQRSIGGYHARGLAMPEGPNIDTSTPELDRVNEMFAQMRERIAASRDAFADAFSGALQDAARGDWRSTLAAVFDNAINGALRSAGRALFDALQLSFGDGGGGWDLGRIGSSIGSLFSRLPKFRDEGTIREGGAGAIDSQLVAFWKSPSERVDIYKPGRDGGAVGSIVRVVPSRYFDVAVEEAAGPVAAKAAAAGTAFAMRAIPAEMGRRGRQQFNGAFG